MATLIIHGIPLSSYGCTCRMACMEMGVPYEFDPVMPQSDEQKAMQPWGSVPATQAHRCGRDAGRKGTSDAPGEPP